MHRQAAGAVRAKNRSTGYASTAGKYRRDVRARRANVRARGIRRWRNAAPQAIAAYALGVKYPGNCQTAPGRSPYFYEEENWVDDMELGAAELHR